jgi:hypothetical protein
MITPSGWQELGQKPDLDEYTVVLDGILRVESRILGMEGRAGQAILVLKGEWVGYSMPSEVGAEYFAVCVPAFPPEASIGTNERAIWGAVRVPPRNLVSGNIVRTDMDRPTELPLRSDVPVL